MGGFTFYLNVRNAPRSPITKSSPPKRFVEFLSNVPITFPVMFPESKNTPVIITARESIVSVFSKIPFTFFFIIF